MKLLLCPGCERHIRSDETTCPFCNASVHFACTGSCDPTPDRGLSRAAVIFLGATALAACGKNDRGSETVAVYGPPPVDTRVQADIDAGPQLMIEPPTVQDAGAVPVKRDP